MLNATRSVLCFWAIVFACCLMVAPGSLQAVQVVRVFVEADEEGQMEVRATALDRALQQGVFQEAEALLRGKLDGPRRSLLHAILAVKAFEYVLGYGEIEYEPTDWGAVMRMDVHVNRQALRGFLQSLGVYFTLDRFVGYALATKALAPGDAALIRDMETLSGLRQDGSDSPALRLSRASGGGWQGILDFEGLVWSGQAQDLPQLWAALWGDYFKVDRVRQGFEDRLALITQGWGGAVDVLAFDQVLRSWDLQAGTVEMVGMSLRPRKVEAKWIITTMDRAGLEAVLASALQDRNIVHSIR